MRPGYVPALGFAALTPAYDLVSRLTLGGTGLGDRVLVHARLEPGARVLDLGCGTGRLLLALAAAGAGRTSFGLDGDPAVLAQAAAKLAGLPARPALVNGLADRLPFADRSFDRVVTCLVFHHLDPTGKRAALSEAHRVLRPGGRLVVADWGAPSGPLARLLFYPVQLFDGFATTTENVEGRLPGLMEAAGFRQVGIPERWATLFGTLAFHTGEVAG